MKLKPSWQQNNTLNEMIESTDELYNILEKAYNYTNELTQYNKEKLNEFLLDKYDNGWYPHISRVHIYSEVYKNEDNHFIRLFEDDNVDELIMELLMLEFDISDKSTYRLLSITEDDVKTIKYYKELL